MGYGLVHIPSCISLTQGGCMHHSEFADKMVNFWITIWCMLAALGVADIIAGLVVGTYDYWKRSVYVSKLPMDRVVIHQQQSEWRRDKQ